MIAIEMSDLAIQKVLGTFIRETRLRQNKTQDQVAEAAGLERMTLVRMEKGGGGTLATLIRVLRCLDQLHVFNQFEVPSQMSPLQLAKVEQGKRFRVRRPSKQLSPNKKNKSDW